MILTPDKAQMADPVKVQADTMPVTSLTAPAICAYYEAIRSDSGTTTHQKNQ